MELLFVAVIALSVFGCLYYWGKQFFILRTCQYKHSQKLSGRACVSCPHNSKCNRAKSCKEYLLYRRIEKLSPEHAKEVWEDIFASDDVDLDN